MAIDRSTQYPGRWNPPTADAPQGSGKNRTAPGSNDGSFFDQVWWNDADSLHQALFIASGITVNGTQDVGTASQIFDALVNNRWSAIGNYSVGTIVTASDGKQYYCNQNSGRDSTVVDPTTDLLDFWREYPYEEIVNSNGTAKKWFNGDLECYINGVTNATTWTFPVQFSGDRPNVQVANLRGNLPGYSTIDVPTTTQVTVYAWLSGGGVSGAVSDLTASGKWV